VILLTSEIPSSPERQASMVEKEVHKGKWTAARPPQQVLD
jgi:hypothetical protein